MNLYNIEFFDNNFVFVDSTTISPCSYRYDYMAMEPSVIELPVISCERGNYISITDNLSGIKYWGFVSSVERMSDSLQISVYPLLEKLDITSYLDRNEIFDTSVENYIATLIKQMYVNNSDTEQNIKGLEVNVLSSTAGSLNLKDNIHNIYDLAIRALKKYQIFIAFDVQISNKKVVCNIRRASNAVPTIEADLENIMNPSLNFRDTHEMVNKVFIYGSYPEDNQNYGTTLSTVYYMQPNGKITKNPTARIVPVIWSTKELEIMEDFEREARDLAYDTLYREELDNYIAFDVSRNDTVVRLSNYEVGQFVDIIKDGKIYRSMYTGFESGAESIRLLFGAVRTEYTKQLAMERRNA